MGIFSKIFHKDELELHDETTLQNEDMAEQEEDEIKVKKNTEPSPFLADEENYIENE